MELVPSISRSSGLEDGGDALEKVKVQEEYHVFTQDKLQRYWLQYPFTSHIKRSASDTQHNAQSNILILFRKLREGLMASRRLDDFALGVYETSLHLSVLFRAPTQTTSILSQLIPQGRGLRGLYETLAEPPALHTASPHQPSFYAPGALSLNKIPTFRRGRPLYRPPHARRTQLPHPSSAFQGGASLISGEQNVELRPGIIITTLIALLHLLVHSYPFQSSYHFQLQSIRHSCFGKKDKGSHEVFKWLRSVATTLASRNYVRFGRLSRSCEVDKVFQCLPALGFQRQGVDLGVSHIAVRCLVEDLREKVRETAWGTLTVAYRELNTVRSADWLLRSLIIDRDCEIKDPQKPPSDCQFVDEWLEQRGELEIKRKEGSPGLWIICRRRI